MNEKFTMYCKFCEKSAEEEPLCATCGKATIDKLGWWSTYSPVLVWPFATWLVGFGAYQLIIAFKPAIGPKLMHVLVFIMLIVFAKGVWATYCRRAFQTRIEVGTNASDVAGDRLRDTNDSPGTVESQVSEYSDEIILDKVEPILGTEVASGARMPFIE